MNTTLSDTHSEAWCNYAESLLVICHFLIAIWALFPRYSLDQGRCWSSMKYTDDPMIVRGLVTEPHSRKRTFSIWGIITNDESKSWQVVTINFEKILQRKCKL